MKKIVPFKKDIIFKTNISEITSISLENTLKVDNNVVSGLFIISGDYKITDTSIDTEKFNYEIPFEMNFDSKYVLDNTIIEIEDFYYEIINNSILAINIEVMIDKIEEILIKKEEKNMDVDIFEEKRCIEEENETKEETNIFNNMNNDNMYKTYKVYIVRENDTIESIMEKYKISKENLELYNDLSEIKLGDKIIIPVINEGN